LKDFVPCGKLFWMESNIEGILGINENADNKIKHALDCLQKVKSPENLPPKIMAPIKEILRLVGAVSY